MMSDLVYKELSYKIVGILFKVYNELGGGYQEKYYQKAIALELRKNNLNFKEQVFVSLDYESENIGRYFLDFIVENKVVLEIKASHHFYQRDVKQVLSYLKKTGLVLGILAGFSKNGLKFKLVLRSNEV